MPPTPETPPVSTRARRGCEFDDREFVRRVWPRDAYAERVRVGSTSDSVARGSSVRVGAESAELQSLRPCAEPAQKNARAELSGSRMAARVRETAVCRPASGARRAGRRAGAMRCSSPMACGCAFAPGEWVTPSATCAHSPRIAQSASGGPLAHPAQRQGRSLGAPCLSTGMRNGRVQQSMSDASRRLTV